MVESIITVVLEVVKCLAPPTESQISYLRSYNNNFENLEKKISEMKGHRESVQHQVDEAKRQGDGIEEIVDKWIESVDKVIDEAEELVHSREAPTNNRCFKGLCPNLKARLQLSKKAMRQLEAISERWEAGRFDRISFHSTPEDIQFLSSKDYEVFESRMSTLKYVLGALKDLDVYMLGIYGMGGIGKTTLAKEVARQVKSEFDQVVFAEVSQSQDIRKIQGEIADKLGLKLSEESEWGRARSLCNRLMNEKRILVILDNIWEKLDLRAVGIPHGDDHKGCKVLLTARSVDVLSKKMDSQRNFRIGALEEDEAWSLFKKMAGDYIEGSEFKSVATEVAKECAGLPVSIVTVARALRYGGLFEWEDALRQLRSPSLTNFKDIQPEAYSAIELSYNKLEGEELKKVFLLIAYAHLVSIDVLLMYGMGLGLFEGINHMQEARNRVLTLVRKLKASCMLLDDIKKGEERFSIHDVVRDVAISIASSREQNVLSMTNGELPHRWESSYTSIVLLDVKINSLLPEELDTPQLKLFRMVSAKRSSSSLTIPDNFFAKIIQVRVLDLTRMHLLPPPSSLGLLTNLQTLCLYECELQDIAVIGNFKKLEIFCLRDCEIKQLPEEIGKLTQLKLLDLRRCWRLQVIPSNVLSKLSRLEELYISDFSFQKWGVDVEGQKNATLDELKHLPNLTSLELQIDGVNILPTGLFFEKLERFVICIGPGYIRQGIELSREFQLDLRNTNISLKDGLIVRLKEVEALCLNQLQDEDVKYLVHEFVKVGSLQLKYLHVGGLVAPNSEMREESTIEIQSIVIISDDDYLFNEKVAIPNLESLSLYSINVERIWQSQLAAMSCGVQNLTNLYINGCRNLKSLFSSSISSCARLQRLDIENCPILEEIIIGDQTERYNFIFPRLQSLVMKDLEKLTCFCSGDVHIEFPSLKRLTISKCPKFSDHDLTKKVAMPNLESINLYSMKVERIWQSQLAAMSCGIQSLTSLEVDACENLKCLFSTSILSSCVRLQTLMIKRCPHLEELIIVDHIETKNFIFPRLQFLVMEDLEKFTCFGTGDVYIEFASLKVLKISGCPEFTMKYKNSDRNSTKKVREESTTDMQPNKIISDYDSLLLEKVAIPNLESIYLYSMKVESIWQSQLAAMSCGIQSLTSLVVDACENLKCLFSTSILSSCVRLQTLMIKRCPHLEELIIVDHMETKNFIFPQLQFLVMEDLEKFTCFSTGDVYIEFASLKELKISGCPEFTMKYRNSDHDLLKKVLVPNLDYLSVEENDLSWIFQSPEDFIRKLKCIDVLFEDESTIIPSLDFLGRFHTLNSLFISGDTVGWNSDENGFMTVIRKDRKFYDMKSILKPSAILNDLETLDFSILESENVMILVPSSTTFHNLTTLTVDCCNGFMKLLTSSTAKSLVRLREMSIRSTNSITEIVTDDEGENTGKDEIIFRELKRLNFFYLGNLTSFYSGNCSLEFPSLETLLVEECPNMMIFSGGELDTPNLHKVQLDRWIEKYWIWEGDLNTSIQRRHLKTEF